MRRVEAAAVLGGQGILLRQVRQAIRHVVPDADVILYGSRARGQARQDSDYDLLVLVDGPATAELEENIRAQLYPIELDTGAVLTLLVYSRADWSSPRHAALPLHEQIERDGVIL